MAVPDVDKFIITMIELADGALLKRTDYKENQASMLELQFENMDKKNESFQGCYLNRRCGNHGTGKGEEEKDAMVLVPVVSGLTHIFTLRSVEHGRRIVKALSNNRIGAGNHGAEE